MVIVLLNWYEKQGKKGKSKIVLQNTQLTQKGLSGNKTYRFVHRYSISWW